MRRILTAGALALIALFVAASTGAARSHKVAAAKCLPGHSHLLVADAQAQVYENRPSTVRGCAYGLKHTYTLGFAAPPVCEGGEGFSSCSDVRLETLAGSIVAYESYETTNSPAEGFSTSWEVVVRDLRNGRVLHEVSTGTPSAPERGYVGVGRVVALVVKSDGAVAWIAEDHEQPSRTVIDYQVHALDKTGSRLLAVGSNIDPHSLALGGSTLYWTQGGKPASAPLN